MKTVHVDSNWHHMDKGLLIYHPEGIKDGETIRGIHDTDEWIGTARAFLDEQGILFWYLELPIT